MRTRPEMEPAGLFPTGPAAADPPAETSEDRRRWIQAEETYAILKGMQREEEQAGVIPPPPWLLLDRGGVVFEYLGGIVLGILTATATLVIVFVIANRLLHLQF